MDGDHEAVVGHALLYYPSRIRTIMQFDKRAPLTIPGALNSAGLEPDGIWSVSIILFTNGNTNAHVDTGVWAERSGAMHFLLYGITREVPFDTKGFPLELDIGRCGATPYPFCKLVIDDICHTFRPG